MAIKQPYLIQGFFFQERLGIGVAHRPVEGAVTVVRPEMVREAFFGTLFPADDFGTPIYRGFMLDGIGDAVLDNVRFEDDELAFTKRYTNVGGRTDEIDYDLRFDGVYWVGNYDGTLVGTGLVRCLVTRVSNDFFSSPPGFE